MAFRPLQESTGIFVGHDKNDRIILLIFNLPRWYPLAKGVLRLDSRRAHQMPDIAIAFLVGCALSFGVGYGVPQQMSPSPRPPYSAPTQFVGALASEGTALRARARRGLGYLAGAPLSARR